jgi:8-oxo-dGTP diphosphatase
MRHYTIGFVFNREMDRVLLVRKRRPEWQAGRWNGIGGKIEENETPLEAMIRETREEIGYHYVWRHCLTFTCPGGTVFVFRSTTLSNVIQYTQVEDEELLVFHVNELPSRIMSNLKWMIPVCLSNIQFPIMVNQTTLGVE